MKCPKCNEEIEKDVKFCTKCGVNIEEEKNRKAEAEKKKQKELEKKQKEAEDRKRLEEIRKQEELKKAEAIKEAEKAEAIRKAKEEGIELEIIDKKPEPEEPSKEFKVKTQPQPEKKEKVQKEKKKKIRIRKNIFQVLINKIILMLILAAIIIGAVYYCYTQKMLPEFAQKEVEEFDKRLQNVINLKKEIKNNNESNPELQVKQEWKVDPKIEAEDIKDLTKEVSIIVKNGKEGLINNETGEIVLEPKYSQIEYANYYEIGKTEAEKTEGIIIKDIEKYYKVDSKYQVSTEVIKLPDIDKGAYFFDHHDNAVYYNNGNGQCSKVAKQTEKKLEICTDIDLVTTEGIAAKDADLPATFTIDFGKSTMTTKGYFDTSTGELVINCDYDEAYDFSEGYAAVKKDKKAGIIDEKGNKVLTLEYEQTRSVHKGAAFAKHEGKWGIIKIK